MQLFFLQVCEWKEPNDLAQLLDLALREVGEPQHQVLQRVKDIAKYSVKTSEAECKVAHLNRLNAAHLRQDPLLFQVTHVFLISSMAGSTIMPWLEDFSVKPSTLTCKAGKVLLFIHCFDPLLKKNNNLRVTMCVSQFHLRGGPSVCVDGG